MIEAVYHVDSIEVMNTLSQAMGFWDEEAQTFIRAGVLPNNGGYFLNHVGIVVQDGAYLPGEWGRLRLNGESTFLQSLGAVVAQTNAPLTVYQYSEALGGWTSDGVNLAPPYVSEIGLIA